MRKVVRLTESDLTRLVKRIVRESEGRSPFGKMGGAGDTWYDASDRPMKDEPSDYSKEKHFGPDEYDDFMEFINDCDTMWCVKVKKMYDRYADSGGITIRK
jgi:hypothetical protein